MFSSYLDIPKPSQVGTYTDHHTGLGHPQLGQMSPLGSMSPGLVQELRVGQWLGAGPAPWQPFKCLTAAVHHPTAPLPRCNFQVNVFIGFFCGFQTCHHPVHSPLGSTPMSLLRCRVYVWWTSGLKLTTLVVLLSSCQLNSKTFLYLFPRNGF